LGIPEGERERVFDMFYRLKNASINGEGGGESGGAGLGLSICRGFIEAHHGKIIARSGEGGIGTSIAIRLPIKAMN
jgi:two-component system sensor histidine kinase KdpD